MNKNKSRKDALRRVDARTLAHVHGGALNAYLKLKAGASGDLIDDAPPESGTVE